MPSACLIIICGIGSKNSLQVRLAEDDHLIQALAAQCADQTFSIAVLPRRLRRDRSIANVRVGSMLCENVPGQILLRIVFSVVPSRRMLRVLVAFVSPRDGNSTCQKNVRVFTEPGPLIDIRRRTARTLTQRCASSLRGGSNIVFENKLSPA